MRDTWRWCNWQAAITWSSPETASEAERLMPGSLALSIDPGKPPPEDDYSDPKYQVPDDLMW